MNSFSKETLRFFKEINNIPRESGNEAQISNYLVNFAKIHKLNYVKDKSKNIIIFKKNCEKEPIILQAHTDMVCVKNKNSNFDFKTDPIKIKKKFGYLCAEETSLGADNGIGVAMILAILSSDLAVNIEAVFTVQEETTMFGANTINLAQLKSKKLLCLDGFCEDTIIVSTAGFADFLVKFSNKKTKTDEKQYKYKITLSGLKGGHSGFDIDKNRGSSHKLIVTFLKMLKNFKLISINGGHNYNVIPSSTTVEILTSLNKNEVENIIKNFIKNYKKQYKNITISIIEQPKSNEYLINGENLINFILNLNEGVIKRDKQNFKHSSLCLSEINSASGNLKIGIRSSNNKYLIKISNKLKDFCNKYKLNGNIQDSQPAFNTYSNSNLVKLLLKTNKKAKVDKLHIATECGIFQNRKKLDIAIISPKIKNAHSTQEKVKISTITSTINWLVKFLQECK